MKVKLPFYPRFKEPLLSGVKIWTARSRAYGKKGDIFEAFGATFEIEQIALMPLEKIAENWKKEGCNSYHDFMTLWLKIHYRVELDYQRCYKVHIFHRIK